MYNITEDNVNGHRIQNGTNWNGVIEYEMQLLGLPESGVYKGQYLEVKAMYTFSTI